MTDVDLTTPRPWRHSIGKVGVGALSAERPSRMYVVINPNGASEAALAATYEDADLICAAVNAYDRLRAVAAAARTLRVETFGRAQNDEDIEAAWDTLRDALDEAPA